MEFCFRTPRKHPRRHQSFGLHLVRTHDRSIAASKQTPDPSLVILSSPTPTSFCRSLLTHFIFSHHHHHQPLFSQKLHIASAKSFFLPFSSRLVLTPSHTFGLFLTHNRRLLLFGTLELGTRLLNDAIAVSVPYLLGKGRRKKGNGRLVDRNAD